MCYTRQDEKNYLVIIPSKSLACGSKKGTVIYGTKNTANKRTKETKKCSNYGTLLRGRRSAKDS